MIARPLISLCLFALLTPNVDAQIFQRFAQQRQNVRSVATQTRNYSAAQYYTQKAVNAATRCVNGGCWAESSLPAVYETALIPRIATPAPVFYAAPRVVALVFTPRAPLAVQKSVATFSAPNLPQAAMNSPVIERIIREEYNGVSGEVARGDDFHRAAVRSIRMARKNGTLTARQAVTIRTRLLAPAFRAEIKNLALAQMVFSGDDSRALPFDDDGKIIETAIDWGGFADFLERIWPLVLQLLQSFGLGG